MRTRFITAAVLAIVAISPLPAQAAKAVGPTLEVRTRSIDDLLGTAEYLAGVVGKEESGKQLRQLILALSTEKEGIEGIDIKKPFGLYATLTANLAETPVVVMVPIADETRFLKMLKDRLNITPEKTDGGFYKAQLPVVNEPVLLQFAGGYLYVIVRSKEAPNELLKPAPFFAQDDGAILSARVRLDRIPEEMKKVALGQLELRINDQRKKDGAKEFETEKKLKDLLTDGLVSALEEVLKDGQEIRYRLLVSPKADELTNEWTLTAKPGSALSGKFARAVTRTSLPLGIAKAKDPLGLAALKLAVPDELQKRYVSFIEDFLAQTIRKANEDAREPAKKVLDALAPTLKAGELDVAASFMGPDERGHYKLLAAVEVKEGKGIAQVLKELAPMIPKPLAEITVDAATVGEFTLHKIVLQNAPENMQALFGTRIVWLATSATAVAVSIEEDGARLKEALRSKPAAVPYARIELALARLLPLAEKKVKPEDMKGIVREAFGGESPKGRDQIEVSLEGDNDKLILRGTIKGKAVRFAVAVDAFKKKEK